MKVIALQSYGLECKTITTMPTVVMDGADRN
jgi:hypothetical protein